MSTSSKVTFMSAITHLKLERRADYQQVRNFTQAHFLLCVCAKSLQSCPPLCDPVDCSPPGSSVHGILQARILEWLAMPSSRGFSSPRDWTRVSWGSCLAGGFLTAEPPLPQAPQSRPPPGPIPGAAGSPHGCVDSGHSGYWACLCPLRAVHPWASYSPSLIPQVLLDPGYHVHQLWWHLSAPSSVPGAGSAENKHQLLKHNCSSSQTASAPSSNDLASHDCPVHLFSHH